MTEFNDYIYPNEYRIALKTAYHANTTVPPEFEWSYHFILQHADGRWSDKHGESPSKILIDQYTNPSAFKWKEIPIFNEQTYEWELIDVYNSEVIYFAIAP